MGRLLLEYGERDVPLILGWPCCEDSNMRLPGASCHSHREPTPDETGTEENSREKEQDQNLGALSEPLGTYSSQHGLSSEDNSQTGVS